MKATMKSIVRAMIFVLLLAPIAAMAQKSPVDKLFEKYANRDGITTVNISGALLSFAAQADGKSAEADMISKLKGIRILTVEDDALNKELDFFKEMEGDSFFKKNDYESLMEITDKDEIVRFYARKADGGQFSELLLIVGGDDNTLISIQGLIDPANIGKITGALDIDIKP